MRSFGSDNHSGIHPRVLEAIAAANTDHNVAYGNDPYTDRVCGAMRGMFGPAADAFVVFGGTGANILSIRTVMRPYHAVVCAETAHLNENETGAPEAVAGCKLIDVPTPDGKLTPELVRPRLSALGNPHKVQPKVISITQPTEMGTLYTVEEIAALAALAHENDMYLHMDGARFGNAVAALGVSPRAMTTDAGVDILSFGGTKNGMMLGEIVVFLRKGLSDGALLLRKQVLQLASKMRFISAQFEAYLKDGLWLEMAAHSNRMAAMLARELEGIEGLRPLQRVEANTVFVELPASAAQRLSATYPCNLSSGDPCSARWMCSFDTTEQDVREFVRAVKEAFR